MPGREFKIFEKLRQNLERADRAPRCEKVREDGTVCGSPQMKGYRYCYAHERMLQMQSQKLELPALEDANGIQMAIMRVQKALIDDEISEKKAGLLLYSLQMASSNLKHTTFTDEQEGSGDGDGCGAGERREHERRHQRVIAKTLPLINADNNDQNHLPRMNAEARGLKPAVETEEIAKIASIAKIAGIGKAKPEHPPRKYGGTQRQRRATAGGGCATRASSGVIG